MYMKIFIYWVVIFLFFVFKVFNIYSLTDEEFFKKYSLFFLHKGFLNKNSNGKITKVQVNGIDSRWIYPFHKPVPSRITSIYEDVYSSGLFLTTSSNLYVSYDYSKNFRKLVGIDKFNSSAYITSSAFSQGKNKFIAIGTAIHGIYLSVNGAVSFKNLNHLIPQIYLGAGYYDVISAIEFSKEETNNLYFSSGVYGDIFLISQKNGFIKKISFPFKKQIIRILDLSSKNVEKILVRTYDNYFYSYFNGQWAFIGKLSLQDQDFVEKSKRMQLAKNKGAIYLTAYTLSNNKAVDEKFKFIKDAGMNAVVIDFKDDNGNLTYSSKLSLPNKLKSVKNLIDVSYILKKARELGIYVIARCVVFKDAKLYYHNNFNHALWNKKTNKPWAHFIEKIDSSGLVKYVQAEHWVDIFSPAIWEYNISIAKEIQSFGVDEIQFDYIRFPSDGPVSFAASRTNKYEMRPVDALESFLIMAREQLHISISVDIYGYNGWFPTNSIGQNISMLSDYVDVISPMFYPSHYTNDFLPSNSYYTKRAYKIYKEGSDRALVFSLDRVVIRPYVQAFLLGKERFVDDEIYLKYLKFQLKGVKESCGSGFSLWNASNVYYMVKGSLKEYLDSF
ncbi:putative glycoside hydrolase [Borreliella lusitaniae]|uniref:Glycoside hydrolase n=1 Tax=Borreliella lusitaniae TaxID=100177 RepID=A0ABZ0CMP1_9SPIR|nr:putative glycoside hydrolase [Borreliella lusitaniae]WNY68393.1 putative glycoside hydrolase [Borreliella lusitaniae]